MKLNKKWTGFMLALTIGGALVGCGKETTPITDSQEAIVEDTQNTEEVIEALEVETEETETEAVETEEQEAVKEDVTEEKQEATQEEVKNEVKEENKTETTKPQATKPAETKPVENTQTKPQTSTPQAKPETKPEASKPEVKPETKPETSTPEVKPEIKPEASTPEVKPETKPEVSTPEVKPEVTSMSAQELMSKVVTDSLDLPMLNPMDSGFFADTYGVDTSILKSYEVRMPMMMVHSTEIAIFELKDAQDAQKVMAGIEKRVEGLKNQWLSYLPDQYELVQNYKTSVKGQYVLFVVSEYADTIINQFNTQVK